METLLISQTRATPEINFSGESGILQINGQSYPENAFKFYEPILSWLDQLFEQDDDSRKIELIISMPYLNTSSSKCMMEILERFESAMLNGRQVGITWYYDEENESELECAEELKEFVDIDFNILPLSK